MELCFGPILTENGARIEMEQTWYNFITFLHKEGVYNEYRNEFHKHCFKHFIPTQVHIEFLKNKHDCLFLAWSFNWGMTNNGDRFWGDINRKWVSYRNGLA
jgi:hypothetical protein